MNNGTPMEIPGSRDMERELPGEPTRRPVGRPRKEPHGLAGDPMRSTIDRMDMRDETMDDRARAAQRAAQIRENGTYAIDPGTEFDIDLSLIPAGWSWQWVRLSTMGKEDSDNMTARYRAGWEPVSAKRFPQLCPHGWTEPHIIRKGLILMERPAEITEEARRRDRQVAVNAVKDKERALGLASPNEMERLTPNVKRNFAPVEIPDR